MSGDVLPAGDFDRIGVQAEVKYQIAHRRPIGARRHEHGVKAGPGAAVDDVSPCQ